MENEKIIWYKKLWFIILISVTSTLIISSLFFALVIGGIRNSNIPDLYEPAPIEDVNTPVDELDNIVKLENGDEARIHYSMNIVEFVDKVVFQGQLNNYSGGYSGYNVEFDLYITDESNNEYITSEYGWESTYAINLTFYEQSGSWDLSIWDISDGGSGELYQSFDGFTMEYNLFINPVSKEVVKTNTFYAENAISAYWTHESGSSETLASYSGVQADELFIQKEMHNGVGKKFAVADNLYYKKLNAETGEIEYPIYGTYTGSWEYGLEETEFVYSDYTDWTLYNEDITIFDDYVNKV